MLAFICYRREHFEEACRLMGVKLPDWCAAIDYNQLRGISHRSTVIRVVVPYYRPTMIEMHAMSEMLDISRVREFRVLELVLP